MKVGNNLARVKRKKKKKKPKINSSHAAKLKMLLVYMRAFLSAIKGGKKEAGSFFLPFLKLDG